jgi:hypothetical protein
MKNEEGRRDGKCFLTLSDDRFDVDKMDTRRRAVVGAGLT